MPFVSDTFTDTDGVLLQNHTGETGATWTEHPSYSTDAKIASNRIRGTATTTSGYYASGVPASADYSVEAVFYVKSLAGNAGVTGRMDTTANTMYTARHNNTTASWEIFKFVAGVSTELGTRFGQALDDETAYTLKLEMIGTTINLYVDDVLRVSATDNAIAAAGRAGLRFTNGGGDLDTTGFHFDSFAANDIGAAWDKLVVPMFAQDPNLTTPIGLRMYTGSGDPPADWTGLGRQNILLLGVG